MDNQLKVFNVKPIVVEDAFKKINLLDNNLYFKIHGSVDIDIDGKNLIFALHHEGLLNPWKRELLAKMVRDKSLLIVGYSGLDFDICPLLLETQLKTVFWYVRGENVDEVMNKLSPNALEFYKQKNGYFIVGKMRDLFLHIKE